MTEIILSAHFITPNNVVSLVPQYRKNIMPAHNGETVQFSIGNVIVVQTIHTDDLFDSRFKCTHEDAWMVTRDEFDRKFNIVNDLNRSEGFALITQK